MTEIMESVKETLKKQEIRLKDEGLAIAIT